MTARAASLENRVNTQDNRPAHFILDGRRRGAHYVEARDYVVSAEVSGELPRLLVGRRARPPRREAAGPAQPLGAPALDGPLFASSNGLHFPRTCARQGAVRDALLAVARDLAFVEVAAPVFAVTQVAVASRVRAAAACLDLAGALLRALDEIAAARVVFPDAAMALFGRVEPALDVVPGLEDVLERATSWAGGQVARVADAVEVHVTLAEAGVEVPGTLRVAWRNRAGGVLDAALDGALPAVPYAPLHLSPELSVLDRLRALAEDALGDRALDGAFVTFGDVRQARTLLSSAPVLLRVLQHRPRIEVTEARLRILVPPAARSVAQAALLCEELLEVWRRATIARTGHALVERPA